MKAQGTKGVNFCLGWKLRVWPHLPPKNILSRGLEQRRYLRCQLEGQGPGQGCSSLGPYQRSLELKEAPMEGKFAPRPAAQLSLP